MFVALKKANLLPGQWVALSGAGGGLGHLAVQYAKSFGYRVLAVDHGSKKGLCLECGADEFIDFTKFDDDGLVEEAKRLTGGGAHAVLVNNASTKVYDQSLLLLRFRGTLVCVGVPDGDTNPIAKALPAFLIMNQLTIVGMNTQTPSFLGQYAETSRNFDRKSERCSRLLGSCIKRTSESTYST